MIEINSMLDRETDNQDLYLEEAKRICKLRIQDKVRQSGEVLYDVPKEPVRTTFSETQILQFPVSRG